jgi:hypothetical protein
MSVSVCNLTFLHDVRERGSIDVHDILTARGIFISPSEVEVDEEHCNANNDDYVLSYNENEVKYLRKTPGEGTLNIAVRVGGTNNWAATEID